LQVQFVVSLNPRIRRIIVKKPITKTTNNIMAV
jgi:hypothetical protein